MDSDSDSDDYVGPYGALPPSLFDSMHSSATAVSAGRPNQNSVIGGHSAEPSETARPSPTLAPVAESTNEIRRGSIAPSASHGARKKGVLGETPWQLERGVQDEDVIWNSFLRLHESKLQQVEQWVEVYLEEVRWSLTLAVSHHVVDKGRRTQGNVQMAALVYIVVQDAVPLSLKAAERYVAAYVGQLLSLILDADWMSAD